MVSHIFLVVDIIRILLLFVEELGIFGSICEHVHAILKKLTMRMNEKVK